MQHSEIGVVLVNAHHLVGLEGVGLVHHHVQRQAHRQVRLERGVHGHQRALGGLVQRCVRGDDAVKHGLAVLRLAHLKVGRLGGGFNEVAGRVDLEQTHTFALDLAAKNHRHQLVDMTVDFE